MDGMESSTLEWNLCPYLPYLPYLPHLPIHTPRIVIFIHIHTEEGCTNGHRFKNSEWIRECDCDICSFPISVFDLFITYLDVIVIAFFPPVISSSWYH